VTDRYLPRFPQDIVDWDTVPVVSDQRYRAEPRSMVVLFIDSVATVDG
jgi:hypothetical protein